MEWTTSARRAIGSTRATDAARNAKNRGRDM
jgi:hypothetical protein